MIFFDFFKMKPKCNFTYQPKDRAPNPEPEHIAWLGCMECMENKLGEWKERCDSHPGEEKGWSDKFAQGIERSGGQPGQRDENPPSVGNIRIKDMDSHK